MHAAPPARRSASCARHSCAVTGAMGGPASASSMAGARTSARVSFPDPKRATTSSQAAGAPGTTAHSASVDGVISSPAWPRERTRSRVRAAGLRPPPRTALTFLVAASKYRQKASPPMPVLVGSHTFRHAVTATAASAAEPPFRRISSPAAVASDCEHATMPLVPSAHVRRLLKSIVVAEARHASAVGGASEPPIAADRTPRAAGCDTTVDVSELPGTVSKRPRDFQVARAWSVDNARQNAL